MANQYTVEKSSTFEGWRQKYNQLALDLEGLSSNFSVLLSTDAPFSTVEIENDSNLMSSWAIDLLIDSKVGDATSNSLTVNNLAGGVGDYDIPYQSEQASGEFALISEPSSGNLRGAGALELQSNRALATEVASGTVSSILGGEENTASGASSVVIGGRRNISSGASSVSCGFGSEASSSYSFAGGNSSVASGWGSFAFGTSSQASGDYSVVSGGETNIAGKHSAIAGGFSNDSGLANYSFIGAGSSNNISSHYTVIAGGLNNGATFSVGGGSEYSVISGGSGNTVNGAYSAIAGGQNNETSGDHSFAVGEGCSALGNHSVAIGNGASASGNASVALGGLNTTTTVNAVSSLAAIGGEVQEDNALAIGSQTRVSHSKSFVLGSGAIGILASSQNNEMTLGFLNGVRIKGAEDDSTSGSLSIDGNDGQLTLYDTNGVSKTITANASNNSLKVGNDPLLSARAENQTELTSFTLNETSYETGKVFFVNDTTATTVTLGSATDGYQAIIIQQGTGTVSIVGASGETVNSKVGSTPSLSQQYAVSTVIHQAGQWFVLGDVV